MGTFNNLFQQFISIGVRDYLPEEAVGKLKMVNLFILQSVLFCTPYYIGLFISGYLELASIFVIVQLLFIFSWIANRNGYFNTSKILIILTTNYAVLTMNFAFGRESGFLFYYFTAPLIIFSLFHYRQTFYVVFGLVLYISSYIVGEVAHSTGLQALFEVNDTTEIWLHYLNSFGAFSYLILLTIGFSKEHYRSLKKLNDHRKELERLLREKNTLLSETHHRVKNNMAVISGLLDLQMMYNDQPELQELLNSSKSRIKSMSLVHESLYHQEDLGQIDFKEYISRIVHEIESSYKTNPNITVHTAIEQVHFNLQTSVPLGLIINEVLTNAFKHAFKEKDSGEIHIELSKKNDSFLLRIIDNGSGIKNSSANSMGFTLIDALAKQIEGSYHFNSSEGTIFELRFN